jgi:ribonuclease P protein component
MAKPNGFGKTEKLKSRKQIDDLFARGKSFAISPIRVSFQFLPAEEKPVFQAGVTASKRNFKKAVDRNRIKRLLREAYRLQKAGLKETAVKNRMSCYLFFLYTDKTIASFSLIHERMGKCLNRLQKTMEQMA